jgi:hypothetical protein
MAEEIPSGDSSGRGLKELEPEVHEKPERRTPVIPVQSEADYFYNKGRHSWDRD